MQAYPHLGSIAFLNSRIPQGEGSKIVYSHLDFKASIEFRILRNEGSVIAHHFDSNDGVFFLQMESSSVLEQEYDLNEMCIITTSI